MPASLVHQAPAARKANLVVTTLTDEVVLYDTASNTLHTLNATAAFVWEQCDGQTSVAEIARRFTQTYSLEDGTDLVWSALDQLDRQDLLQKNVERPEWVVGITRRDLMKRIAVGALVALPLVRSLVAPTPAQAQSNPSSTTDDPGTSTSTSTSTSTTTSTSTSTTTSTSTSTTTSTSTSTTTSTSTSTTPAPPTIGRFWHQ